MRRIGLLLAFILFCLQPAIAVDTALPAQAWVEVKSPNFIVVSNAGQQKARQTAVRLEQFRAAFERCFPGFRLNTAEPIVVLALKNEDTMKELSPQYWENPNGLHPTFLFQSGWEQSFAAVRIDLDHSFDDLDGDYVYELLNLNFVRMPSWLRTGIVQFFIPTVISENEVKLGMPSHWEPYLRRKPSPPIPLADLLKESQGPVQKNKWLAADFQAETWALTHMLIVGPNMGNGAKLDEFIKGLSKESDQVKAFEDTFGKVSDVYVQLDHYTRQHGFVALGMKNPPSVQSLAITPRDLSKGEVATYFAQFEQVRGRWQEADEWLAVALKEKPDSAAAHRVKGFQLFQHDQDAEAIAEFAKAVELDPKDYLAKYFAVMMKYGSPRTDADNAQLAQGLKEVRTLNPNFAPAHVELSFAYLRNGQPDRALEAARYAAQLEPGRAGYQANVARILLLKGDAAGAAAQSRFVAERWNGTDRDQAIEIWRDAVAKDHALGNPPLAVHSDAPEGATARGAIVSAQCADKDARRAAEIVIRDGDKLIHLHGDMEKPMRIGFEDTLWYGHNHFSFCRHVEGRMIDVIYKPSGENEGVIVQLRIEDLPPSEVPKAAGQ